MSKQDYRDAVRREHECSRCDSIFYGDASRVYCGLCVDATPTDSTAEQSPITEVTAK